MDKPNCDICLKTIENWISGIPNTLQHGEYHTELAVYLASKRGVMFAHTACMLAIDKVISDAITTIRGVREVNGTITF